MKLIKRYWIALLLIAMVFVHAAIIGYVRSQISRLDNVPTTTITIGSFQFQPSTQPTSVYRFDLHAVLDPARRHQGEERIVNRRMEILEAAEQLLRQIPVEALEDPNQTVLRERLMEVILEQIAEPVVQRVVITGWLHLPVPEPRFPPPLASESEAPIAHRQPAPAERLES